MSSIGRDPIFIDRAQGAFIWDVDGNRYVDYLGTWGPAILGHAPKVVIDAVAAALPNGTSFGAPTEREIVFAEVVCEMVPSIEQLRMTSSGSEAVMGALRVARAATGRDVIVKTVGGYHGALDPLLAEAGSGATTLGVPTSPGVPDGATATTRLVPFNDAEAAAAALEGAAAMIVEPVAGNMGVVPPQPGYLEGLRAACDATGALLIFDEVMTGFRVAPGGAQELYGVTPDLTCLGKVIGGGLPVGAFGGPREIMRVLAPEGPPAPAFTAEQIPGIDNRTYPAELAGPLYPEGIPVYAEEELPRLIGELNVDECAFLPQLAHGHAGERQVGHAERGPERRATRDVDPECECHGGRDERHAEEG